MAMYAIAITPLIRSLKNDEIKQVWFSDDVTTGGGLRTAHSRERTRLPVLSKSF